ncbi:MAG: penicillin-insensitive murein endopeptidase [Nannocystis sp.]|nr:penicillin-insensitive murein endopeptidase [Nannocystis sp.]
MPPPLQRPARPRALLIHHSAPAQPWRALVLRGPTVTIGAAPTCDLILDSPGVAPRHCTLHQRPRGFLLHDHGAPLGTYLDARRLLAPITLTAAAALTIGPHHLHIVPLPDPPHPCPRPASPPAPPVHLPARPQPHLAATSPPRPLLLAGLGLCAATSALTLTLAFIALIADPPPGAFASQILSAAPARSPAAPAAPAATTQTHPPATESTPAPALTNHSSALPQRTAHLAQARPPAPRRALRVEHGETWASLAERLGRDVNALQADNPHLRRPLRRGDRLRIATPAAITPIHTCALPLEVPRGALAVGPVDRGRLHDAVRLPPLPIYHLRCPAHAFASSATAAQLIAAITCFRDHTGYRGELVIGDLSRESGGPLGPHLSHQTGHDVDLWLPTLHGDYLRGCHHCRTDYCRPEPSDIDWLATWQLIDALAATGGIHVIFLDRQHHPQLAAAALSAGVDPQRVADRLPAAAHPLPRPSKPPLVQHADGHSHHLHVRFKCPDSAPECQTRPNARVRP